MSQSYLMPPSKIFWTYRIFRKIWWKGSNALCPPLRPTNHNPNPYSHLVPNITSSMWEYAIILLCTILCKIYENFLALTIWIIPILPLYISMKRVVFQFLIWKPQIVAKICFSNHSYCLLLIITQCGLVSLSTHFAV